MTDTETMLALLAAGLGFCSFMAGRDYGQRLVRLIGRRYRHG